MVSLHKPTPVDSQEEAAASQSAAATANGALPGGFQAPAGFVLKGVPSTHLAMTLYMQPSWLSVCLLRASL